MAYPFAQFDARRPPAAEGYVPSFLSKLPFIRRSSKGTASGYHKPPANQLVLEPLEPRVLLAADLSFGAATDYTLQFDPLFNEYQLVDDLEGVFSRVNSDAVDGIDDDGVLDIEGSGGDDRLTLDWATLLGGSAINFTGSGMDTLSVLSDSDMKLTNSELTVNGLGYTISGFNDAHLVGGASANTLDASGFSGNVRLEGAGGDDTLIGGSGDNVLIGGEGDDTFQFTPTGALKGSVAGGAGSDALDFSDFTSNLDITLHADSTFTVFDGLNTVTGIAGVENILGSAGTNNYTLETGASISGSNVSAIPNNNIAPLLAGPSLLLVDGARLNTVIDTLLESFDPNNTDPNATFTFTTAHPDVPDIIAVGENSNGADLELEDIALTFSSLEFDLRWDGDVFVKAPTVTFFPDGLGIEITDDVDMDAVSGSIDLVHVPDTANVLHFDPLDAADLGWPVWLDIEITNLELEFADFRADDTDSILRLDGSFLGFDSGIDFVNEQIRNFLSVEGSVNGIEFDMDILGDAQGLLDLVKTFPITDISGISGEVSGNLFGAAGLSAGFIAKLVKLDDKGNFTTVDAEVDKTIFYLAARGSVSFGGFEVPGENGGESTTEGAFALGLNFAISELGPLQFFAFIEAPIVVEPYSGLSISALRAGISFNTSIEDRQLSTIDATAGSRIQTSLNPPEYTITLTVPGHNLRQGDEFEITEAEDAPGYLSGSESSVVDTVDGDDITYRVTEDPDVFFGTAKVRKISISDPLDLRDEGFQSTKDLSLSDWESQLDRAVANQAGNENVWDHLFAPVLIEGGAAMSFDPRIPDNVLGLEVDFLFDTELRLLLSGKMTLGGVVELPSKIFIDLSVIDGGPVTFLFLQEAPGVPDLIADLFPDVEPLLVYRGGISFEILINGSPASLDRITGFPSGVGTSVLEGAVFEHTGPGGAPGPWEVTFTLDSVEPLSNKFAKGDSLVVVGSDPVLFDGTHIVTDVNDSLKTVSFRIGTAVIDSEIDLNFDNIIDALDVGLLGGIPVIGGLLDINRNGTVNEEDDGEIFDVITDERGNRRVVAYKVFDGRVDVDGDGIVIMDTDDDAVIGEDPGEWAGDSLVANLNELGTGFRIMLEGGLDLNIPFVTTLTLEGDATLDFLILPDPDVDEDLLINFSFNASLSETNFGTIGDAIGAFHATIDFDPVFQPDPELPVFEIWGAAILETDFGFLEPVGLFADASGLLRINNSVDKKPAEVLTVSEGSEVREVRVELPAESFALRLDGSIDFNILGSDFFSISGIFVFEFSADQGFNVAIFDEVINPMTNDLEIEAASLVFGPAGSTLLEVNVQGLLAIRGFAFAASFILDFKADDAELLGLASIEGRAVFIINTTEDDVEFFIPGGAADPNRPDNLTLEIPRALPDDPSGFFSGVDLQELIDGRPWDLDLATLGAAYGVVFLEGMIKLSIPDVSTLTLEGKVAMDFEFPPTLLPEDPDLVMNFSFDASLSESNIGEIAQTSGAFHARIDFDPILNFELPIVEIWGAAVLTSNLTFLEDIGLFVDATGLLRINFTNTDRVETLRKTNGDLINVELPAFSFALRLDGGVDFRIDFDGNSIFTESESIFLISGIFVLEFSPEQGFNVAIFDDRSGMVGPATLRLGTASSPLLQVDVQGLLAIRNDGIAASLVLGLDAELPLNLASINGAAVLVVNTTGREISYEVPGDGTDPNRRDGLALVIPKAAPLNPSAILGAPGPDPDPKFNALITGNPSWDEGEEGAYGVVFIRGSLELVSVLNLDVSGFVLLGADGLAFKAQYSAGADFLGLASAEASGSLFFNSQGEFSLHVDARVSTFILIGHLVGDASLDITYLDSDGEGFGGDGNKVLDIVGNVGVSVDLLGALPEVTIGNVGVIYDGASGAVSITFSHLWFNPFKFRKTTTVVVAYLTIDPPPPPVLGQVDNGVLTLNVGSRAAARNLLVGVLDEGVSIGRVGSDIQVTMFNVTQTFSNVSRIEADMGDGDDFMEIQSSVMTPVNVRFGAGEDILRNLGSGTVVAYGDGGDDRLEGGSANDQLFGGLGEDFIDGGGGQDRIEGGDNDDILIGGVGLDTILGGRGEDLIAGDQAFIDGDEITAVFRTIASASGGTDTIEGGDGTDTIFGGSGSDNITGDAGEDSLFGDDGEITILSGSLSAITPLSLNFSGNDRFNWSVGDDDDTIDGQGGTDTLDIFGTINPEQVTVNAAGAGFTAGIGAETLNADGVEVSNIDGRQGSDTFTINDLTTSVLRQINLMLGGDSVQDAVTVNGSSSDEVFAIAPSANALRVQKTGGVTIDISDTNATSGGDTITLNTAAGADTIHVGRLALATGGTVDDLAALLTVNGGADSDILNVDDTGDMNPNTGTLTATTITGLDMAGSINYGTIETLNIGLGSGGDTFTIESTHTGATTLNTNDGNDTVNVQTIDGATTVNTGSDDDVINVGSTGGTVDGIAALLTISGDDPIISSDVLNVDDTGDTNPNTGTLTASTITGLDMAGSINYGTIETLNIGLGSGGDDFTIESTHTGTTRLDTNAGNDTVNVRTIDGDTTVNTGADDDTVNVGSNASSTSNTGGNLLGIQAQLVIDGGEGSDLIDIDASGDATDQAAILTANSLTGLGMAGGIQYNGIEDLDLTLGAGNDIVNVRGTSATTDLSLGDGDDKVYVSSDANVDLISQVGFDFLTGHLDDLQGNLNIDAGAGRHLLMVSDEASIIGDGSVLITDQPVIGLPAEAEIAITGLALGAISYRTNEDANFADGITVWTGAGNDNISVDGTHRRDGVRTTTTLNTGGGTDTVDVALTEGEDGFFVLNTQAGGDIVDASASSLPLIIFGGEGDDDITSGSGDDIIFGDRGRVEYRDNTGNLVAVLGNGGPGDFTDGVERNPSLLFTVNPEVIGNDTIFGRNGLDIVFGGGGGDVIDGFSSDAAGDIIFGDHGQAIFDTNGILMEVISIDPDEGSGDKITGGRGTNIVIGGVGDDAILAGGDVFPDVILGDNGRALFNENGTLTFIQTTSPMNGGADQITAGNGRNILLGGSDADTITGGVGDDIVLGDNGRAEFNEDGVLTLIESTNPDVGGTDQINAGDGRNILFGGTDADTVTSGVGDDVVLGDNGRAEFSDAGILTFIETTNPIIGGSDFIETGNGTDIVLGGSRGDTILAGGTDAARDIVLGDNGFAVLTELGVLTQISTTDPDQGGEDIIVGGNGPDVIFGGSGGDTIVAGGTDDAEDIVFGDNARATFQGTETFDAGEESAILSFNFNASSSIRTVTGTAGAGAARADNWNNLRGDGPTTFGDNSGEIVVFDDGSIAPGITIEWGEDLDTRPDDLSTDSHSQINATNGTQDDRLFEGYLYTSTSHTVGVDIGGLSNHFATYDVYVYLDADNSRSRSGTSVRAISDGSTTFYLNDADGNTFTGIYHQVDSTNPNAPEAGNYVVFTGLTGDIASIRIDDDRTLLASNSNRPAINGLQIVGQSNPIDRIESIDPGIGGNDILITGGGADIAVGGYGSDIIDTFGPSVRGEVDTDIVVGDNARATFMLGDLREIRTTSPGIGGNDVIRTGNGDDIVLGGNGNDDINTGATNASFDNGDVTILSINFNSGVSKGVVTGVAGAAQADNWNNLISQSSGDDDDNGPSSETAGDLILDNGDAATGVAVTWAAHHNSHTHGADRDSHSQIDNPGTQNERLSEGYLHTSTSRTLGVDIIGLGSTFTDPYDVYVYLDADNSKSRSGESIRSLTLGTTTLLLDDPDGNTFSGEFVEAAGGTGNYVVFRNVSGDALSLRIDNVGTSSSNRPAITALQVVGGMDKDTIVTGGDFDRDAVAGDNGVARFLNSDLYELATTDPTLAGNDTIQTGEDADIALGGSGNDTIDGEAGHDLLLGDNARIILFGGEVVGLDTSSTGNGDDDDDGPHFDPFNVTGIQLQEFGTGGDDTLIGGTDDDLMYGQAGNDTFVFAGLGLGNDRVVEADRYDPLPNDLHDRLDFSMFGGPVNIDLSRSSLQTVNGGSFEGDTNLRLTLFSRTAFEDVTGSAFNDDIDGNSRNNILIGGDGDDTIRGHAGDDLLLGNEGDDWIRGGSGDDLIDGGAGNDVIYADGSGDDDDDDDDESPGGRDLVLGGLGNDTIYGGGNADIIDGEDGNDRIYGGSGNDVILGGAGNDTLRGDSGNDTIEGGLGLDSINGGSGADNIEPETGSDPLLAAAVASFSAHFDLEGFMVNTPIEDRPLRPWVDSFLDSLPGNDFALMMAQSASESTATATLTHGQLEKIFNAAITRWASVGFIDQSRLATLDELEFYITDMAGLTLGRSSGNRIFIDPNAAGHGWFVDETPDFNEEFALSRNGWVAKPNSAAYGKMDLMTVVSHEIGHYLGLDHDDSALSVMSDTLQHSQRYMGENSILSSAFFAAGSAFMEEALGLTESEEDASEDTQAQIFDLESGTFVTGESEASSDESDWYIDEGEPETDEDVYALLSLDDEGLTQLAGLNLDKNNDQNASKINWNSRFKE